MSFPLPPQGFNSPPSIRCRGSGGADFPHLNQKRPFAFCLSPFAFFLKVSRRTIYRDSEYAQAVDAIVSIMGEEIRSQILTKSTTRGYYLSKKKTIELGKLAKMKPEEVIDFFEPDVVKRLENEHERRRFEFNFKVNEVVLIKPKDNTEIKHCKGYWAIIININELKFCDLKMWNQTLLEVSPQNFVSLNLSDDECRQMNEICGRRRRSFAERLLLLREKHNDALTYNIFQFFAHLKNPHLSEFQKHILDFLDVTPRPSSKIRLST